MFRLSEFNPLYIFIPFGVILFAFMGSDAMPEARIVMGKNLKNYKKAVILGSLIPIALYLIFSFVVVGSFSNIPEIATLTLGKLFIVLGIFVIFTVTFYQSTILKDAYKLDLRFRKWKAWALTIIIPYILFLIVVGFDILGFIEIVGLAGAISGGILGILIMLSVKKAKQHGKRTPEYEIHSSWIVIGLLSLIFIAGIIYSIIQFFL